MTRRNVGTCDGRRRIARAALAIAAGGFLYAPRAVIAQDATDPVALLRAQADDAPVDPAEQEAAYRKAIAWLAPRLCAEAPVEREAALAALHELQVGAGRPGQEARRSALCRALCDVIRDEKRPEARVALLKPLERVGDEESVPLLTELLGGDDALVSETARRALQMNPSAQAGTALCEALAAAGTHERRVALVSALAARGENGCIEQVVLLARSGSGDAAIAAVDALTRLGGPGGDELRRIRREGGDEPIRLRASAALVALLDDQSREDAARVSASEVRALLAEARPAAQRAALLQILARTDGAGCVQELIRSASSDEAMSVRGVAAQLLAPSAEGAAALVSMMADAPPPMVEISLAALTDHNPRAAASAALGAMGHADEFVRIAALEALSRVGDAGVIPQVAARAATSSGAERDAARAALDRLAAPGAIDAIRAGALSSADAEARGELIGALTRRLGDEALPDLFTLAMDPQASVRAAALESLAPLARRDDLLRLFEAVISESDPRASAAAENALVRLLQREGGRDPAALLEPHWAGVGVDGRGKLLRAWARVRGPTALAQVRGSIHDDSVETRDAAIRALCAWERADVLPDLERLAREGADETHRVLAIRGAVRLLRGSDAPPAREGLALLRGLQSACTRDEERRLVVAALGATPCVDALVAARDALANPALLDDAASALCEMSPALSGSEGEACAQALQAAIEAQPSPAAAARIRATLESLERHAGYVARWEVSPAFELEGGTFTKLFEHNFEPETGGDAYADWSALHAPSADNAWITDFTRIDSGSNRCRYVRVAILSDTARPVRLEIGSDDGVKAWLNGQLVHSNPANRPVKLGEDVVPARLAAGRNILMLKVVQSGGGWGVACGVRDESGAPIRSLQFEP